MRLEDAEAAIGEHAVIRSVHRDGAVLEPALGLFGGTLLGALTFTSGHVILTLGGGILIGGLVAGWYHARHPLIRNIPS